MDLWVLLALYYSFHAHVTLLYNFNDLGRVKNENRGGYF